MAGRCPKKPDLLKENDAWNVLANQSVTIRISERDRERLELLKDFTKSHFSVLFRRWIQYELERLARELKGLLKKEQRSLTLSEELRQVIKVKGKTRWEKRKLEWKRNMEKARIRKMDRERWRMKKEQDEREAREGRERKLEEIKERENSLRDPQPAPVHFSAGRWKRGISGPLAKKIKSRRKIT